MTNFWVKSRTKGMVSSCDSTRWFIKGRINVLARIKQMSLYKLSSIIFTHQDRKINVHFTEFSQWAQNLK